MTGAGDLRVRPREMAGEVWNQVVESSPSATIYHTDRWLDLLMRSYGMRLSLVTLEKGPETLAACVLARSKNPFRARFVSLPFSDSCPPLARDDEAMNDLLQGLAIDQRFRAGCEIRGVDAGKPWETLSCFADWRLDLTRPLSAIERALHANFRRNLRRATKLRVTVERGRGSEHVARFYWMLLETRRHLGVPPQPLRMFKLLQEIFNDGGLEIWLASQDGRDAAGVILLQHRESLYYRWGARRLAAPSGINQLLFWTIIEESAGKFAVFDLGRTDIRNQGLSRFKRELGANSFVLPYAYLPKAPRHASAEVLNGPRKVLSQLWRHLPLPATRLLGAALYGYLA